MVILNINTLLTNFNSEDIEPVTEELTITEILETLIKKIEEEQDELDVEEEILFLT